MAGSTYVPANETYLFDDGWLNGSLYLQTLLSSDYGYMYANNSQHMHSVNLTILPNDVAAVTFLAPNGSYVSSAFQLVNFMFSNDTFIFPVDCVYPISSQYGVMPRGLFYLLLILSLVFRRHTLLSTAALGSAMTYSGTAVVHLFALLAHYRWTKDEASDPNSTVNFGDLDLFGIFPILAAAGIMLAPILNWSLTIRRHRAQAVIIWWGIMVFVALIPSWIYMYSFGQDFDFDVLDAFAGCPRTKDPVCNPDLWDLTDLTYEIYTRCNCVDFCSTLSPTAPMRMGQNMVAWVGRKISWHVGSGDHFWKLWTFNFFALPFIFIYGVFGILASHSSPAAVRNAFFKFLSSGRRQWIHVLFEGSRQEKMLDKFHIDQKVSQRHTLFRRLRYNLARLVAACIYLGSMAGAILAPAVFIISVVSNEILIGLFPVSEHHDAVGAWSPWVSVALVLVAALVVRYYRPFLISTRIALESLWSLFRYSKVQRQEFGSNVHTRETVRHRLTKFKKELGIPFQHSWSRGILMGWQIRVKYAEFVWWWRNTAEASALNDREIRAWQKEWAPKPKCSCYACVHGEEKREKRREETRRRREIHSQPYDSNDSEDEAELQAVLDYFQARVKRRLGPDFHICRRAKEQFAGSSASSPVDKSAMKSPAIPDYTDLPNYEYLLKRVKRRLGENYEIVKTPSAEDFPRPYLSRSDQTWGSDNTMYSPYTGSDSQKDLVQDGKPNTQ